jgi:hypothetical protein
MAKPNKAMNEQRVTEVMQLLLQGAEFNEIRVYAANKGWELTDRQVRRHINAAYRRTTDILGQKQEELLARHLLQRRNLFARCLKAEDLRTALQVLHDEAQLIGLYPARKIAPTTPDGKAPYEAIPGFAALVPEIEQALERLGCGPGPEDLGADETLGPLGPGAEGPGFADGSGGYATGPVAETFAPLPVAEELAPLLPPSGEEHGDGDAGPADGPA